MLQYMFTIPAMPQKMIGAIAASLFSNTGYSGKLLVTIASCPPLSKRAGANTAHCPCGWIPSAVKLLLLAQGDELKLVT